MNEAVVHTLVIMNGTEIGLVNKVNSLGVIFNVTLKWDDNAKSVCSKMCYGLRTLTVYEKTTPRNIKILLVKSHIKSDYSDKVVLLKYQRFFEEHVVQG